jgi:hypothetical protein
MSPGRTVSHKLMSEHTGDAISIFEEIVPVGEGTPLHIHHTSDEVIHLIEGQLLMKLETALQRSSPERGSSFREVRHTHGGTTVRVRLARRTFSILQTAQSSSKNGGCSDQCVPPLWEKSWHS